MAWCCQISIETTNIRIQKSTQKLTWYINILRDVLRNANWHANCRYFSKSFFKKRNRFTNWTLNEKFKRFFDERELLRYRSVTMTLKTNNNTSVSFFRKIQLTILVVTWQRDHRSQSARQYRFVQSSARCTLIFDILFF